MSKKDRDQVADLILKDSDNNDLVVSSRLEADGDGSMSFEVMKHLKNYPRDASEIERYRVTITIEDL